MTTATKITLIRVVCIPIFMVLLLLGHNILALLVFILASATDFVDGYIARHCDQVSDFGKFLDPLADKLLVLSAMLIFCQWGRMASWIIMVVLAREFAVSGLRMVAASKGNVIAAGWSGKIKTVCTMIGLCVMMVFSINILDFIIEAVILLTTVVSGAEYFIKNGRVLLE